MRIQKTVRALKRLGQNFLTDPSVAKFMVDSARICKKDRVLEIGPGKGMITRFLAKRAGKVYAIEKDRRMAEFLRGLGIEIIWGDATRIDWPEVNKIVANLPFNISSKVLFKIRPPVELAVLGLQKEFAKRLVAKPGSENYGRLSASASFVFESRLLRTYPPSVFEPEPKVELAVVLLKPKQRPQGWAELETLIRGIFCYPNKKTDKALELAGYERLGLEKRVRELTPDEISQIFQKIRQNRKCA